MAFPNMFGNIGGKQFGQVASPAPYRKGSSPARTDIRFYQERAGQAESMDKVIGTTSAPSSAHQLTGFTADGYAIWEKQAAPAPSGGGGGGGGGAPAPAPGPDYAAQIAALNKQAADYRKQAEEIIAQGQAKVKELEDADLQRQKATELQNRLAIQSAANQARGQAAASLQIRPAGQTSATGGTEGFKRRANQFGMTRRSASTGPVNPYEQVNV